MALLECVSSQRGVPSRMVEVEGITDEQVATARARLDALLVSGIQVSDAVASAYAELVQTCRLANPSDLWQHVIYRHLLKEGWSDQRWKRVSGFALERAFVRLYAPRLEPYDLRLRIVEEKEANYILAKTGINDTKSTKIDLFIEGKRLHDWVVFGSAHVKSSIAERIQDDVPASRAFMERGLLSIALTMDAKSYPPPHGDCINYGELGGRSLGIEKERLKRGYIETYGQFDGLFSFNARTSPSPEVTASGKKIHTMSFNRKQPDKLVRLLVERWKSHPNVIEP